MKTDYSLASAAYFAYAVSTDGKTFDGRPLRAWGELPERTKDAWLAAVDAVLTEARSRGEALK